MGDYRVMAEAAGPLAAVTSLASLGFKASSDVMKGEATASANQAQAARLERAAEFGQLQAEQAGGQLTEKLNVTLGNINTIRAAGGIDPTSPTTAALLERTEELGTRERGITMGNLYRQAQQDKMDADYLRKAGDYARATSKVGATAGVLGGLSKGLENLFGSKRGGD